MGHTLKFLDTNKYTDACIFAFTKAKNTYQQLCDYTRVNFSFFKTMNF